MKRELCKLCLWFLKKYADDGETKLEILTEVISKHFNMVSADEILKINSDGTLRFEDKTLHSSYRKELGEQARNLENTLLWKVLTKDIQYHLNKKLFYDSAGSQDIVSAKLLIYLWNEVILKRIKQMK